VHYEPDWGKRTNLCGYQLKSIDLDYENKLINIIIYPSNGKERVYNVSANNIRDIKFRIHHGTSSHERDVAYFRIKYLKNVRNGEILFYLPWRYDKEMISDFQNFANTFNIPFKIEKNMSLLTWVLIFFLIYAIIQLLHYYI
jgi:hypothetical protein